jgi:hypothetical protein
MRKQGEDNKDDTRWTTHFSKEIVYLVADLVKTFHSNTNNTLKKSIFSKEYNHSVEPSYQSDNCMPDNLGMHPAQCQTKKKLGMICQPGSPSVHTQVRHCNIAITVIKNLIQTKQIVHLFYQ